MERSNIAQVLKCTVQANLNVTQGHQVYRSLLNDTSFFTREKIQELVGNPLFPPECISVFTSGVHRDLTPLRVWRKVQQRSVSFFPFGELLSIVSRSDTSCVIEGLDNYCPSIAVLAREVDKISPLLLSNVACFWSKKGNETYRGHRDSQSVLAVQLSGSKLWKVYRPQGQRLLGNDKLTEEQMGELADEIALEPGDALFVAGGVPHICSTASEESIHLAFDLCIRSLTAEQIGQRLFDVFNHSPFAGSGANAVRERLVEILSSQSFQELSQEDERNHLKQMALFRERIAVDPRD